MTPKLRRRPWERTVCVCATAITLGLCAGSPTWAGRPLTTEDTGTLDPGSVEVEVGLDYVRDGGAEVSLLPGGPTLNFGLLPRLEGGIATAFVLLAPEDKPARAGFGDSTLKLKYRFLDETSYRPALMAAVTTRLPTGDEDRGLGQPGADVQALAIASKTLGAVTLTLNAGYTFITRDRRLDVANVNASAEAAITSAWSIVGEVVSELATIRGADDRLVLRMGTVYAIGERVRLDAAAGFGATRASPDVLLTIGITVTLNHR